MKTLIITGTCNTHYNQGKIVVDYNLHLFGQSPEHPKCVFIQAVVLKNSHYVDMVNHCKTGYADYFKTDDFNIISMENINRI